MTDFEFDVFISHATEDKAAFVSPLAIALRKYGLKVWFDKFTLKVGDSLRGEIEKGLARSRYGIVVFSPKFLLKKKRWPQAELSALFAREMEGHKVVLPVWHNVSAKRMKTMFPIQADKYALQSSDGVDTVARSLVETIRPELLELDVRRASAFDAGDSFRAEARKKYPGFDFSVESGPVADSDSQGAKFRVAKGGRRIQIHIPDPAAIAKPPGGRVQFFGEGVKKAIEFQRTGKPQKWEPGEFELLDWNIPFMSSHVEGSTLAVGERNLPNIPPRHIRLEVGSPPVVVFPIMEMRSVRLGTHEAEAVLSDKELPLSINMTFPIASDGVPAKSRKVELTLSWDTVGKRVSESKKLIDAVDALRRGMALRFIDIRMEQLVFESNARISGRADPFAGPIRRTILLASQIEQKFSVPLRMPDVISEEDGESLFHLDCLLNGREYGRAANTTLRLVKADGEEGAAQEAFIKGEWSVTLSDTPSNYPGYFALFGQRVKTSPWIRVMEFAPVEPGADTKAFAEASIGSEYKVKVTAKGPTHLRWKGNETEPIPDGPKKGNALSARQSQSRRRLKSSG